MERLSSYEADRLNDALYGMDKDGVGQTQVSARYVRTDSDGTAWVRFEGADKDTPLTSPMAVRAVEGDLIDVSLGGYEATGGGNRTDPSAGFQDVRAVNIAVERIKGKQAEFKKVTAKEIEAEKARLGEVEADTAKIHDLTAEQLQAATAYIASLTAGNITAQSLIADVGKVHNLTAEQLSAAAAYISALTAGSVTAQNIIADHGDFATVKANAAKVANLTAAQLEADHATVANLDTNYAHADLANVDNAWISNGTIKDGAISNAMINELSANKLTVGSTLDASKIYVTNLNADNITVGTINGQRIGEGSLSLDKLSEDVYTEAEVDAMLDTMQAEIDGAIETWTGTAVPTLNNAPASAWTTAADRDKHVGDVYFVVNSQSQQNGYNYRFTKSGTSYSWQLIKDNDVTNALQRLETAEGKITQFDSDISTLKTDTGTLTTRTTSLETRADGVDSTLLDKVDVTDFNSLEDTVDGHTQTLSQHTTAISNKADGSTVTALTTRVSKNEQDISGINTTIGELQTTVESKADGSDLTTVSNRLNTVSDTVDGHTQTISSVQSTLSTKADNSTVATLRSEYNETKTTVSGHETRLSATESVANGVRADFDNLEIGGRNLLRGSAVLGATGTTHGWISNGGTPSLDTVDGIECIKVASTTANSYIASARTASRVNLEWGQTYIASCWLMFNEDVSNSFGDFRPLHFRAGSVATTNVFDLDILNHGGGVSTSEVEPDASYGNTIPANTWVRFVRKIVTADSAPNADYPYPVFAPIIYGPLRKVTTADEHITWIRGFKVERGTVPTAWTPAPEDMESEVTSLKTDYANYKQTTTEALSEIGTTYATKTELGTETSNRQTAIQQVNDAIALKANSSDVYTKAQTDGLISTEVTNRNAAITAKADEITSSVSETYATKDSVSGIDTRLTTAESSITQQAGEIALKANAADTYTKAQTDASLTLKANKATLTSEINASADTVKIDAARVNIEGAAIFTSGRLSQSSLDGAYDASGAASAAQAEAISAAAADATSKANAAQTAATNAANQATDQKLTSYSTTSQMNEAIGDAVDAIEVGGRNLLEGSGTGLGWGYSTFKDGVFTRSTTATTESYIPGKTTMPLELGETYTFSAWMKTNGQVSSVEMFLHDASKKTVMSHNFGTLTTEWAYYTWTVTMPDAWGSGTNTTAAWDAGFDNNGSKTSGTEAILYVKQPKLERGNKATDWSAAPEDTSAVNDRVDYYNRSCKAGNTTSTQTKYWRRVASTKLTDAYYDTMIQFTVESPHHYTLTKNGILKAHIRTGNAKGKFVNAQLYWLSRGTGIELGDYAILHKAVLDDGVYAELWCRVPNSYETRVFYVNAETNRTTILTRSDWTLYDDYSAEGQDLPSDGWTQVLSADANAAQATADAAAPKTQAVKRTQRIWYRKSASGAPTTPGPWVTNGNSDSSWTKYNAWSTRIPPIAESKAEGATKYLYLYTCEQREMADGTLAYTTVLLDDSTTVIDGGNIITGSVAANKIVGHSISADQLTVGVNNSIADAATTATNYITEVTGGGIKVHDANDTSDYVQITSDGMDVYNDGESVARFGSDGAQIGVADGLHTVIDEDSFDMFTDEAESNSIFHVGYPTGATVTDTFAGDGTTTGYMLSNTPSGGVSVMIDGTATSAFSVSGTTLTMTTAPASGAVIAASYPTAAYIPYYTLGVRGGNAGKYSTAEGYNTTASGPYSHAEGYLATASGPNSHAEGRQTTASGWYSHAEGYNTTASGSCSHAEGYQTTASGPFSHAEGYLTTASEPFSHAEGYQTTASGWYSHAQNDRTVAAKDSQTAIGTYNTEDTATTTTHPSGDSRYGKYALVIGNGTGDDNRSNAFAVEWDGTTVHGTDMSTTVVGDVISPASGITIGSVHCETWGRLASFYMRFTPSAAKSGTWDVGTLVMGLRPPLEQGAWTGDASHNAWILPTGEVKYNGSVAAGSNTYIKATYLLA